MHSDEASCTGYKRSHIRSPFFRNRPDAFGMSEADSRAGHKQKMVNSQVIAARTILYVAVGRDGAHRTPVPVPDWLECELFRVDGGNKSNILIRVFRLYFLVEAEGGALRYA